MFSKSLYRKSRRFLKLDPYIREDIKTEKRFIGTEYGGWSINPSIINEKSIVYSFGLGQDISFDKQMIAIFGVTVHGFDPTPKSIAWLKKQSLDQRFFLHEYGLSDHDGSITFYHPPKKQDVSYSISNRSKSKNKLEKVVLPVRSLSSIISELNHENIDILKLDIEGSEYSVIDQLVKTELRPTQILIEFHHRFPSYKKSDTVSAIMKLKKIGYKIFNVSERNMEYSFLYSK